MHLRAAPLVFALAALAACTKPAEPEPQAPPELPPPAPTPADAHPGHELPKKAGVKCEYKLQDILTETLGDQLAAGHQADVRFSLTTGITETGTLTYALSVEHVHVEGKREAYSVSLDSDDHGHMVRVRGGADTLLMFDAVLYFALIGQRVVFHVDDAGRLLRVEGGDEIRARYLALHPPKPREAPHQKARVAVALSDEALARRFLPFAAIAPRRGGLAPRTIPPTRAEHDFAEYAADVMRAARLRWVEGDLVLEEKRAFAPTRRAPTHPGPTGYPKVGLLSGEDQTTVALPPDTPCFARAATTFSTRRTWQGMLEDEEITTEQRREGTWLVHPPHEAPVLKKPASKPASQPAKLH